MKKLLMIAALMYWCGGYYPAYYYSYYWYPYCGGWYWY